MIPFSLRLRAVLRLCAATALLTPFAAKAQGDANASDSANDPQAEMQQIRSEFEEVKTTLAETQQVAMQREPVKDAMGRVQTELESVMLDQAPDHSDKIERFFALAEEISSASQETPDPDKISQLQSLQQELAPVLQQASQAQPVVEARAQTQEVLLEVMEEIDPETLQLLERQRTLMARFEALQAQAQDAGNS